MFPCLNFKAFKCPIANCQRGYDCLYSHAKAQDKKRSYDSELILSRHLKRATSSNSLDIPSIPNVSIPIIPIPTPITQNKKPKPSIHATFINTSKPPIIPLDVNSKVPRQSRQRCLDKYYTEFCRIYQPIISKFPQLAHEHAFKQESTIHEKSTNKTYSTRATSTLMRLRKRPVAIHDQDIGIDGDWSHNPHKWSVPRNKLLDLCMDNLDLVKYNYPLGVQENTQITLEDNACSNNASETQVPDIQDSVKIPVKQHKDDTNCARCHSIFRLKYPLNEFDEELCHYHHGNLRMTLVDGSKVRSYSCCQGELGSKGCCRGPHVFKEETFNQLNARIPFIKLGDHSEGHLEVVALDCEMSYTMCGMELTRVTVVNWQGESVFDELCKPKYPILDLNTRFSGISSLADAKYDFEEIQERLKQLMSKDTIMIGHGLENDLNAMRIIHDKIIDTAWMFPHPKGFPYRYSLRALVQQHLGRFIQRGSNGHDAFEDAHSAICLVKNQIEKTFQKK